MTETNGTRPDASEPAPPATHRGYLRLGPVLMLGLAAIILLLDQVTKIAAVAALEGGPAIHVVGETVRLVLVRNPGAAFSLGTDATVVFSVIATVVVVFLLWFSRRIHSSWWAWGLGLMLGGAAGNLVDRFVRAPGILQGHVVDFVSVGWWPVFNVADASLVTGVIVIAVAVLRGIDYDGSRLNDGAGKNAGKHTGDNADESVDTAGEDPEEDTKDG